MDDTDSSSIEEDLKKGFKAIKNSTGFDVVPVLHMPEKVFYSLDEDTQKAIRTSTNLLLL